MPTVVATAADLFAPPPLPAGLDYREDFVTRDEQVRLLAMFADLPFREATFQQYTARRRVVRFGRDYAAGAGQWIDGEPVPEWLAALRARVALAGNLDEAAFMHALVTEYRPGTPIGWHRDKPEYGRVFGISLGSACRMRFRPFDRRDDRKAVIALELSPRSLYAMRDDIRWHWQHSIAPVKALRYSITFRTAA
ncbi:MAG TPA: alpha-ketoglutarate-dependent dioxygenase AlkB [Casimicrobiaceae bacterium]|nr:alpha-ketoglutarate-dependent dioxygenase AlkB [Casimicrobiaceae bacterium]